MVYLCIACIVLSSIALHGIAFDYLLWHCMVLHRLHSVVQLFWRAGELPRSHFMYILIFPQYRQSTLRFILILHPYCILIALS